MMAFTQGRVWRLFITSPLLQALVIGLLASLLAKGLWTLAPVTYSALDWALYDSWLRVRAPIATSDALTVVVRDPDSEARFGATLDRAVLAQFISAAHDAGAAAIGIDHRLDHASPASLGGAASDALFIEALHAAGPVVLVHDPETALETGAAITGHVLVSVQPDRVTRTIPLLAAVEGKPVTAFGALLYDVYRQQPVPVHQSLISDQVSTVLNPVGDGSLPALATTTLSSVWDAIQHDNRRELEERFKSKIVVLLPNDLSRGPWLLPTGQSVAGIVAHLHLLNSWLTGNEIGVVSRWIAFGLTLLLASAIGLGLLRYPGSRGLLFAGCGDLLYLAVTTVVLWTIHLVLPLSLPLTAAGFVIIAAIAWTHLTAGPRMMLLEQDMLRMQQDAAAIREALTLRESRAEALEEDLEAANAAVAQSTAEREELVGHTALLQSEILEIRAQEQAARRQLEQVERQLTDLRAVSTDSPTLADAELERLKAESRALGIITQHSVLLRMFRDLKKGAASPLTVLLLGEPGTGKELFARAVHRLSPRAGQVFVAVNMAAISPELFESELFGHVKGSFTGATGDRKGYFELANHGTIFLDEIGDLRLDHQSKLLRVLQEKSFYRVGATVPSAVDVRIVAATNRDLQRGVSEGWFREDLYFRLKGFVFRLPPLRERAEDIGLVAESALADIAQRMGKPRPELSTDALRLLSAYRWPGNVRELRNVLERAVALTDGAILSRHAFSLDDTLGGDDGEGPAASFPDAAGDRAVLECLRRQGFDMQATANLLGWDRSTVTQRLKGLCFQALIEHHGDQARAAMAIAGDPAHMRTVELKLSDYFNHLLSVMQPCTSIEEALTECKRRFKNLPDRHFASVDTLVRQHFQQKMTSPSTNVVTRLVE
ncbi:MAG TPA: sigma 54-interacting transcriptional regulator [Nitrospira sp.]|jgi:transcriptional regulator with PAS, ATPase and Fis domain